MWFPACQTRRKPAASYIPEELKRRRGGFRRNRARPEAGVRLAKGKEKVSEGKSLAHIFSCFRCQLYESAYRAPCNCNSAGFNYEHASSPLRLVGEQMEERHSH